MVRNIDGYTLDDLATAVRSGRRGARDQAPGAIRQRGATRPEAALSYFAGVPARRLPARASSTGRSFGPARAVRYWVPLRLRWTAMTVTASGARKTIFPLSSGSTTTMSRSGRLQAR